MADPKETPEDLVEEVKKVEESDDKLGGDSGQSGDDTSGVARAEQDKSESGEGLSGDTESDSPPAPSTR